MANGKAEMQPHPAKMESHHIFHFARKYLGRSMLYVFFGRKNTRIVEYWCQDPLYTAKPDDAYDPLLGVKRLLKALDDHGHCGVVRACFDYLFSGTSIECGINPEIVEPLPTIKDEILADYRSVAALQAAIEDGLDPDEVEALKIKAIAELERTYARYLKDYER